MKWLVCFSICFTISILAQQTLAQRENEYEDYPDQANRGQENNDNATVTVTTAPPLPSPQPDQPALPDEAVTAERPDEPQQPTNRPDAEQGTTDVPLTNEVPSRPEDGGQDRPTDRPADGEENNSIPDDKPIQKKPLESGSGCPEGSDLESRVNQVIEEKLPRRLLLTDARHGSRIKLTLEKGFIELPKRKLMAQATCDERGGVQKYDFMVEFDRPAGAYTWKVENLFGRNFNESALITMDKVLAEFKMTFDKASNGWTLDKANVGKMYNLDVIVNLPPDVIKTSNIFHTALKYVVSRLTTFIVNRSKNDISKDIGRSLSEATFKSMAF